MSTFTDHVVNMAAEHGVPVNFGGRITNVSPTGDYEYDFGPYGAMVHTFDADDLATLIRIFYRNGDHLPSMCNADGSPIPSPLVAHGVRPSTITGDEIRRLAGGEYMARVVAEVDEYLGDFGPPEGGMVSMATFSAGRDYIGGGTWEYDEVRVDAEDAELTADKVREIHGKAAGYRNGIYSAFRALTYSGARGIHTVGSFGGSQAHISCVHHERGTSEHDMAYHDALAWVPAEVIAENFPDGPVSYEPDGGWLDDNGLSAEAEVERWCARMVAGDLETMDEVVRGEVYVVSVEDAVITAEDDEDDPDWENVDLCGGYTGDDADPTVYASGAFYMLVEAVVNSLAKGAEVAAKLADQAARHAEWREATDPEEYALVREILGHQLPYIFTDEDLDAALARRGLRLIFTHDGRPAVMSADEN